MKRLVQIPLKSCSYPIVPEEKARYMKVGLMAEGMERHTLRKAIAAGETE